MLTLQVVGTDIKFSTKLRPVISNVEDIAEEIRRIDWEKYIQATIDHGGGIDECVKKWNTEYAKVFGGNNHWPVGHSWPSHHDMSKERAEVYANEISYQDAVASIGNFFVVSRDMPRWEMNPEWDLRAAVWEYGHILGAGYATIDEACEAKKYCRLNAPGTIIERKDLKAYTECKTHQAFNALIHKKFEIPAIPIEEGADELLDNMMNRLGMNKIEYIDEDVEEL
tara:strand:- start:1588 stop:2262 length:675 start_codon:yes stop_codon:yes gene_type:complete